MKPFLSYFSGVLPALFFLSSTNLPDLDGQISAGEWDKAVKYQLKEGGEAFLHIDNNILYLALKGSQQGWGHIYLKSGDTIYILHASAALGTGIYNKKSSGLWEPIQKFDWQLRERVFDNNLKTKMDTFFLKYGWVANNNNTGSGNVLEYKIDLSRLTDKDRKIAFLFTSDKDHPHCFPNNLSDDAIYPDVLFGNMPAGRKFDPAVWLSLKF